jgi:pyruvate/2-oxoacid:ferredoxin oxidoreductase alpha subunit
MQKRIKILTANHAAAWACKGAKVGVVAAYPITPQSPVVEEISRLVEAGEMDNTQFITVESEQSAITAVIAASATGSRVFTASSANGLAYMFELLNWAAGNRLPVVMNIVTRALAAPWNVWCDHQDAISVRDCGWIQMFCEDNQEVYDTNLMAFKIAEDPRLYIPTFVCYDGYILSHTVAPVQIESDEDIAAFIPPLKHHINITDFDDVKGMSPVTTPDMIIRAEGVYPGYMEFRYSLQKALESAVDIIKEVHAEFAKRFGRDYGNGVLKKYRTEDAKILVVGMGSISSELRGVVDQLREQQIPIGIIALKLFRPFPKLDIIEAIGDAQIVVVFDRDVGYGFEGVLSYEIKASLYNSGKNPYVKGYIVGLGGRDVRPEDLEFGIKKAMEEAKKRPYQVETEFLGTKVKEIEQMEENGVCLK